MISLAGSILLLRDFTSTAADDDDGLMCTQSAQFGQMISLAGSFRAVESNWSARRSHVC